MPTATDLPALIRRSARMRAVLVHLSHLTRTAHLGSCLSCVDILAALFDAMDTNRIAANAGDRDRFILSKGHAANALYVMLAEIGCLDPELLLGIGKPGSCLEEHPFLHCAPGVEVASGSLGHGLPIGAGMALASRISGPPYRVFVLMSDGECNEGSVWEAAMFAAGKQLGGLTAIVDFNKWQATDRSCEVLALQPLREKWAAFGWEAIEVDGHSLPELQGALRLPSTGRPRAIIANTVKGRGVSFMEDDNNWHYRIPSREEAEKARQELGVAAEELAFLDSATSDKRGL